MKNVTMTKPMRINKKSLTAAVRLIEVASGGYASPSRLEPHILSLSDEIIKDMWALMYLGRNRPLDMVFGMTVNEGFAAYKAEARSNAKRGVTDMAVHIASKSIKLHEYLEEGLRLIGRGDLIDN